MKDYKWDENGDLLIENGDFVRTDGTLQHQHTIIKNPQGTFKANPEIGVGIESALNDESLKATLQRIKRHLEYDGQEVENISLIEGKINIKAQYPNQ